MDGVNLAKVVAIGLRLLSNRLFTISMYFLWFYDYFLTFGDEVTYAWSGRKSWVFALFIANRYIPLVHVLFRVTTTFYYKRLFCRHIIWESLLYTTIVIVIAQITMCLRVYAVTRRNKLLCGVLSALIAAQLSFGIYFAVVDGTGPIQKFPEISLDMFHVCVPQERRHVELAFISISVAFDLFTFLIILVTARGSRTAIFPGIPSILGAILRDATVYFLLIVAAQMVLFLFFLFAPPQFRFLPGLSHVVFLPMMVSRLMFSLRKTAAEQVGSFSTTGNSSMGRPPDGGSIRFAQQWFDVSHEISTALAPSSGETIELDSQSSRDRGSQKSC